MTDACVSRSHSADKIRLGAISFINTLPIYHHFPEREDIEIVYDSPSRLNRAMLQGELDVSPVSSAFYLRHQEQFVLLDDLSVSSPGSVESVLFLSRKPMGPALLDHPVIAVPDSSETSVALLAHMLQRATGQDLQGWFQVYPAADYRATLEETGAILMIGDDALRIHEEGLPSDVYCYDLASLWAEEMGLPFVFAVWIARKELAESCPERIQALNRQLIESRDWFFSSPEHLQEGVRIAKCRCTISAERLQGYFTRSLTYGLSPKHLESLEAFDAILNPLDSTQRDRNQPFVADRYDPSASRPEVSL